MAGSPPRSNGGCVRLPLRSKQTESARLRRFLCSSPAHGCCANGEERRTPSSCWMTASSTTASGTYL
jgi:hypothetical protein